MSDEKKKRRMMSQTERDLAGLAASKQRASTRVDQVSDLADATAEDAPTDRIPVVRDGVPVEDSDRHVTSPIELLARELDDREMAVVDELRRDPNIEGRDGPDLGAPVAWREFVKLLVRTNDNRAQNLATRKDASDRLLEAMGKRPPAQEFKSIKRRVNIIWALLVAALTAAGGSSMLVVNWLKDRGASEVMQREMADHDADYSRRIRQLEDDQIRLKEKVDELLRRRGVDGFDATGVGSH